VRLLRKKYSGRVGERFGPTLASEHLASEDNLEVHAETLRRWMLAEGLWSRARKRKQHRERREAKEHFGELVRMDGSFHKWFEERGPEGCLMNLVDDATGSTLGRLGEQETIWAAAGALRRWIEKYGVPVALYTDGPDNLAVCRVGSPPKAHDQHSAPYCLCSSLLRPKSNLHPISPRSYRRPGL
jgi:hypothetical protein